MTTSEEYLLPGTVRLRTLQNIDAVNVREISINFLKHFTARGSDDNIVFLTIFCL